MTTVSTIGLLGFGRIGQALYDRIEASPNFELAYAYVRAEKDALASEQQITDPARLSEEPVDLCVEAATHEVLAELGSRVLHASDLMVLSGSAFAEDGVETRLTAAAETNNTAVYLPHAALFGIDGLVDARDALTSVEIVATKAPDHLDFSYTTERSPDDVDGRTTLYDGPVRGLCQLFPRNFNSHACVALASLGLDDTRTTLIADPDIDTADHVITAAGEGFELEIVRKSEITGVTGNYTLISTWGSIQRVLHGNDGLQFV